MGLGLAMANYVSGKLPTSRCFGLRAYLYRFAGLRVDPTARIVSSARFWVVGECVVGRDTYIGHQVLIVGSSHAIRIGSHVDLAPRVTIVSGTHEIDMIGEHSAGEGTGAEVCIEDGVWIGAGATILPGVTIGKKSVIGAGSLVNKDIPPNVIAVGNPCHPIKVWNSIEEQWQQIGR